MPSTSLYGRILIAVLMLTMSAACRDGREYMATPTDEASKGSSRKSMSETSTSDLSSTDGADNAPASVILFLGNSLSAGYGINHRQAFPSLIEERIDSLGWDFRIVNAGISGDTSADGLARLDGLLHHPISVLVLELGANDGLRGVSPAITKRNLRTIIERTRTHHPDVRLLIVGMMVPPELGEVHFRQFAAVFPDLAAEFDADLVPFLLEGVAGVRTLNQPDGIHPTAAGQRIMAENVWTHLRPILESLIDA